MQDLVRTLALEPVPPFSTQLGEPGEKHQQPHRASARPTCKEQTMTQTAAQQPPHPPPTLATVADVMRPPLSTTHTSDHAAAAAYLMKHAGATALVVLDPRTGQPNGILTEADIAHAVADGKDLNEVPIRELMTIRPPVITPGNYRR
jgi:signal-transduction protein with cAMP-binding, CBS, and nucleotidyltransferase domain